MEGYGFKCLSLGLLVCIVTWGQLQQAGGDTFVHSNTWEVVSVQCFSFVGNQVQSNYGLWWMQADELSLLSFTSMSTNTSTITCHFVSLANGSHQWFPVYNSSGLAIPCAPNCHWSITDNGFFLHNPTANGDTRVYTWLPPPDAWVAPPF